MAAYATPLEFAERSGLGLRIIDENVGTADNSETDFDLDNINVTAGSYNLVHAAAATPNTQVALTETTHYTLDAESGRIVLTASGVTAAGTDVIYATYWYTDNFSSSVISNLIAVADDEIDLMTAQKWDTPTSVVEYRNGRSSSTYPKTDRPFQLDFNEPDFIILEQQPVTSVDFVYFLSRPQQISQLFNYDTGTSAFTDNTTAVNSTTESPFNLFDDAPATGDIIYIGSGNIFLGLEVNLSTVGVDNGTTAIDWEYWNGTAWTDLTETDTDTGASIFTASGRFTWTFPYGWAQTTVNSSNNYYWIRGTLTDDYSTDPIVSTMVIQDSVSEIIEPFNYSLRGDGQLNFIGKGVSNGTNNLRIDYNYGHVTTPTYITELSIMTASVKSYINLSGGSYDDATSYTLGSKSVTIGEVYVNIREVISQFKKRIDEIYAMIGKRSDILAI